MLRFSQWTTLICLYCVSGPGMSATEPEAGPIAVSASDWPWWRGPTRDGVAAAKQNPVLKWSDTENVLWKATIPGRGHGSPTIVGDRVFLATADIPNQVQSMLCFDRKTGKQLWQTPVHQDGLKKDANGKSTLASSTPACDGRRVFINFLNNSAIYTTALDLDGKQLWQVKITDFVTHQGFGSSPALYKSLVIVSADNKGTGAIAALNRATGKVVWTLERPKVPNYTSPVILKIDGKDQLLFTGCDLVSSFEPLTGKKLWEIKGATTECVTSTVTDGHCIFTSGGYPRNHLSAVKADGSGKIAWEKNTRIYVPSMLVKDGHLYAALDAGVAMCWKCDTGEEKWKGRLGGGFTASPVLVNDLIYAVNESGKTFIVKANPDSFEVVAENQLGDEAFATPAICGDRIYMRVAAAKKGERQEFLYCLGKAE